MRKFKLSLTFTLIFINLLLTACAGQSTSTVSHGGPVTDYISLVDSLRAEGFIVELAGNVSQPFFAPEGTVLAVDGEQVQVFEFSSVADADAVTESISDDGSSVGTMMMLWVAAPHFYKIDKLVVLYVGENERVINVLEELFGPQIAGR